MPHDPDLLTLAHAVLRKQRDSTWDSRGTPPEELSQTSVCRGTAEPSIKQGDNPTGGSVGCHKRVGSLFAK
jgi:hypothetical protein